MMKKLPIWERLDFTFSEGTRGPSDPSPSKMPSQLCEFSSDGGGFTVEVELTTCELDPRQSDATCQMFCSLIISLYTKSVENQCFPSASHSPSIPLVGRMHIAAFPF